MHDYLQKIINNKRQEVAALHEEVAANSHHPLVGVLTGDTNIAPRKSLRHALTRIPWAVIAEIKRRSPSKAHLADILDPIALAKLYVEGGAAAISVLTDYSGFGGSLTDLSKVAAALADFPVAILRKDFILEEIQIAESILSGADAVLLIVAVLKENTRALLAAAKRMHIDALVEVHTLDELKFAIEIGAQIIGVNNRDLNSFSLNLECSRQLIKHMPSSSTLLKIAESGIDTPQIGAELIGLGYNALLIGEALVKATQPDKFITDIKMIMEKEQQFWAKFN